MKIRRITLLASLLVMACNAFSQTDSTERYKLQYFLPDSGTVYYSCMNEWTIGGDTLIGGKRMKKVYSGDSYYCAVREDTSTAKYYAVYEYSKEETLLIDFSVEAGDFITDSVIENIPPENLVGWFPQAIDVFFDRFGRKNVQVEHIHSIITWVEGIGCKNDMVFDPKYGVADHWGDNLLQVKSNDSVIYEHELYGMQDLCTTDIINMPVGINIYPNPASSYLIVDLEQIDCLSYEIITPVGVVCQSSELSNTIDISDVPSGINHLIVRNGDGDILYFSKFIKK